MAPSPVGQREAAAKALREAGVIIRRGARATSVGPPLKELKSSSPSSSAASLTLRSPDGGETTEDYDAVCWAVGQRVESPEAWPFPRDEKTKKILTDATLRVSGHARVFALGDVASATGDAAAAAAAAEDYNAAPPARGAFPSTAQVAFQQADYAAWNIWASVSDRPLLPFKYQHLGDMMVLGKVNAAVALPVGDATIDGEGEGGEVLVTGVRRFTSRFPFPMTVCCLSNAAAPFVFPSRVALPREVNDGKILSSSCFQESRSSGFHQ